jgi:hypothetical protein
MPYISNQQAKQGLKDKPAGNANGEKEIGLELESRLIGACGTIMGQPGIWRTKPP